MKIFLAMVTARQVEGDMVWIKVEKAHVQASEIDTYIKANVGRYLESFNSEFGPVQCECTRGVMEVELEGIEERGENDTTT